MVCPMQKTHLGEDTRVDGTSNNLATYGRGGKRFTHRGETLTVIEWSRKTGIPKRTINARHAAGKSVVEILDPDKLIKSGPHTQREKLELSGATASYTVWAKRVGIPVGALRNLVGRGWKLSWDHDSHETTIKGVWTAPERGRVEESDCF